MTVVQNTDSLILNSWDYQVTYVHHSIYGSNIGGQQASGLTVKMWSSNILKFALLNLADVIIVSRPNSVSCSSQWLSNGPRSPIQAFKSGEPVKGLNPIKTGHDSGCVQHMSSFLILVELHLRFTKHKSAYKFGTTFRAGSDASCGCNRAKPSACLS